MPAYYSKQRKEEKGKVIEQKLVEIIEERERERERVVCLYYDKRAVYSPELFEWPSNSHKILQNGTTSMRKIYPP